MNLGDPELEFIDPTPDIHNLFINFDKIFFCTKLASRVIVRWSKRMYSCAGVCSYEGGGGLCAISLSEPLLKLRPRKDLIETLLHEMIHAYLFVVVRDRDRDGHGPNFRAHMHRINKFAGLNISIYHNFHDEVELYLTHWWRCNGPCQTRRPHFGIVRRSANRAPGPTDFWWNDHKRQCSGTFVKIKEPEQRKKLEKQGKKSHVVKSTADITKYITNNKTSSKSILKDSNVIPVKTATKSNNTSAVVVTQKGNKNGITSSQHINKPPPVLFSGKGQTISGVRNRSNSVGVVVETVRNIWANKQLPEFVCNNQNAGNCKEPVGNSAVVRSSLLNTNKQKAESEHADSPPSKVKKIDDYFKTAATVLKDVYGQDFNVTQSRNGMKLVATVSTESELVDCPVCKAKVKSIDVNGHLDECLNKEIIENLCNDAQGNNSQMPKTPNPNINSLKEIVGFLPPIPAFNQLSSVIIKPENTYTPQSKDTQPVDEFDPNDINRVKSIAKKITYDKIIRKSDNFIVPKDEKTGDVDFGYLPSFLDDIACKIETPPIKLEPGTSRDIISELDCQKCACCGKKLVKPIEEHLDECPAFFVNDTIPDDGASTSFTIETIVIDDDDIFDETLTLNATGTKLPCPCCLKMTEEANMNDHLDKCLG